MTQAFDDDTLRFYRGNATAYAERQPRSATLTKFLGELPAGAKILELGCGAGYQAEAMLAAGFDVARCSHPAIPPRWPRQSPPRLTT